MDRSTLSPLVPLLWLLSINLAGLGVAQGLFNASVWVGVLCVCMVLGWMMYRAALQDRRS